MTLHDYIRILHKNWILILLTTLVGVGAGALASFLTPPTYQTSTQLYVSVRTSENAATGDLVQGTTFARQIVASYVDIVDTAIVLEPVVDDLGLDLTARQLSGKISATSPLNTVLIDITVSDRDPQLAADIANAVGTSFTAVVQDELESPAADGTSPIQITTVQPATAPTTPVSPRTPLNLALGALLGLALGVGIAVLRVVLDTRIHSAHDIEQITEKPLLGGIAFDPDASERPLIVHADPKNPRAESFRSLRTNLQFLQAGEGGTRSFVVSSAGPAEGKSTTTANLAIALAETGARVALLDGDLRLPKVATYMGIEGAVGLTDVLIGRVELVDALQRWGRTRLYVLPAGQVPPNPSELLGSAAMDQLMRALREHFDYVLIDAPPLLLVTDAAVVSKKTDGVVLAAASGLTKKQALHGAVRTLETAGAELLGVVVTKLPTKGPDSYGYGDYSYGGYGIDSGELEKRRSAESAALRGAKK